MDVTGNPSISAGTVTSVEGPVYPVMVTKALSAEISYCNPFSVVPAGSAAGAASTVEVTTSGVTSDALSSANMAAGQDAAIMESANAALKALRDSILIVLTSVHILFW